MLQAAALLAISIGIFMLAYGGYWYWKIASDEDPDPWRLCGSWVSTLVDLEKWELTWRPIALQVVGGLLFAWGCSAVQLPA